MVGKRDRMCFNFVEISVDFRGVFGARASFLCLRARDVSSLAGIFVQRSVGLEPCRCLVQEDNGEDE